jgi:hypothetical protein
MADELAGEGNLDLIGIYRSEARLLPHPTDGPII